ncbi:MAG: hypothetical protein AAF415_17250 [Pseudomonadota bacterium]
MAGRAFAEIEAALDRIENSGRLGERSRLRDILRYLVTEELHGRGGRISGYSIGVDVLSRPEEFDPNTDSIVRTEVNRLRQALELYFNTEGVADPVRIEIPKGSYRPLITHVEPRRRKPMRAIALLVGMLVAGTAAFYAATQFQGGATRPAEVFNGPRLIVLPLTPVGGSGAIEALASGVSFELISDLTQYPWLAVSSLPSRADPTPPAATGADFYLSGEIAVLNGTLTTTVSLSTGPDQQLVWTKRVERAFQAEDIAELQRHLAFEIATALGEREGVVPSLLLSNRSPLDDVSVENLTCLMRIYSYWEEPSAPEHAYMRECLIEATSRSPGHAEAWAALAFIYMDEGREGLNIRPDADHWDDAQKAVDTALEIAPLSSLVLNAAMTLAVAHPVPDHEAFRRYGERELEMRPNNAFALANFGAKMALNAGDWKQGMLLHGRALELDVHPPSWVHFAPAYQALLFGSQAELTETSTRLSPRGSKPVELLRAISAHAAGDEAALRESLEQLKDGGIATRQHALTYIENRRFTPALAQKLAEEIETLPGLD